MHRTSVSRATLPHPSLVEVLRGHAASRPGALALYHLHELSEPRSHLDYAALDRRVRAVAARLQASGPPGSRALLVLDNDPRYVVAFLACLYAGWIAVPLYAPTQPRHVQRLAHVAHDCDAGHLLTASSLPEKLRAAIGSAVDSSIGRVEVDEVPDEESERWEPHRPAGADVAYLQYTSGSTGRPRGVVVSHDNLVYQGEYLQRLFDFTPRDHALSWLPLFHDMGLILGVLEPLYTGFPVGIASPTAFIKSPDRWLRAISEHRVTYSPGPNFCFDLCVDAVDPEQIPGLDLSTWAVALNAAEPVRAATIDRFVARFAPYGFRAEAMIPGYGLAEATIGVSTKVRGTRHVERTIDLAAFERHRIVPAQVGGPFGAPLAPLAQVGGPFGAPLAPLAQVGGPFGANSPVGGPFEAPRAPRAPLAAKTVRLVSSGRFLPDTDVRIVDPATRVVCEPDRVGEIWVTSTGLARGYWGQAEETARTFGARLDGDPRPFMRTGDLGFCDESGNLFITGRLKDVIIVHGCNHYPNDIEQTVEGASTALRPHFLAAFAVESGERESLVIAAEVRRERVPELDPAAVASDVVRAVSIRHGIAVDEVVFLHQGQLPMTTSGKVQRSLCRELLRTGALRTHAVVRRADLVSGAGFLGGPSEPPLPARMLGGPSEPPLPPGMLGGPSEPPLPPGMLGGPSEPPLPPGRLQLAASESA